MKRSPLIETIGEDIERIEDFLGAPPPEEERGYRAELSAEQVERKTLRTTLATLSGIGLAVIALLLTRSTGNVNWLLVLTLALAGGVFLFKKFEIGVVLFLSLCWIAVGTPAVAQGGSGVSKNILLSQAGLGLLLLVWIVRIFARQDFTLYRTPLNWAIALYLAICVWATVNSFLFPDPHVEMYGPRRYAQVNWFELGTRFLALGGLLMVANTLHGRVLRWASLAILLPGVATFTGLLSFLPQSVYLSWPQVIAMAILFSFALTWQRGMNWLRITTAVLAAGIFFLYLIKGASWMSGWMAAVVAVAVILFVYNRRLFAIVCAVSAVAVLVNWPFFYKHVWKDNFQTVSSHRFDMMKGAVMYARHFPMGVGLGNYRSYNSYYGRPDVWGTKTYTSAHNTYSQALAESGWLGLVSMLLMFGIALGMLYRYYRLLPDGYARMYTLGALGSLAGICWAAVAGDYLFPAYHNGGLASFGSCVYTFLMIGVVIAFAREKESEMQAAAIVKPPEPVVLRPIYNRPAFPRPTEGG